jgi:fatty-acyl-CoA synthase
MKRAHLLDRLIGAELPEFPTDKELRAFEATPYDERIAAHSTYEALKIGAAQDPQAPAIHFLQRCEPDETPLTITHAEFLAKVTQTANLLADLGVGPRDVVSFMLPLLPQSFHTLFGAEAAGIANPVNSLLEPVQIAEILRATGTKVLVALAPAPGTDIWQKVERVRRELPGLKAILQVNGPGDEPNGVYSYDALLAKYPSDRLASGRRIAADDVAAYFHTGGTTGTPKLVRHTHRNQVYQAWVCNLVLRSKPGRKILFGLPLYHVGGALTQGLTTFAGGGAVVVLSPSGWRNQTAVKNIWKLVERYKPEIFGGVPTVLAASLHIPVAGADISSLRYASGGGSAIPVAVGKGLQQQLGVPVLEVYGMTETSSVHTIAYTGRPVRLGSVGHAVPYSKVRVVRIDASGRFAGDCAANEIGVVAMAGPGVFSGYLSESHNRGAFVEPGWVNSGDLGRLDEDGYLWITGRAKDLIIRGGHNIDPLPVEEILFQHPAVALAALVGQPDAYAGELPLAYVQLKTGANATAADLVEFVRERTPERAAVPVNVVVIDAMPLTGVGKVFKPQLRWDAAQRVFAAALADLSQSGQSVSVSVGAHPVHGNLATVAISGVPSAERASIEQKVHERLNPFVLRHEVEWR